MEHLNTIWFYGDVIGYLLNESDVNKFVTLGVIITNDEMV